MVGHRRRFSEIVMESYSRELEDGNRPSQLDSGRLEGRGNTKSVHCTQRRRTTCLWLLATSGRMCYAVAPGRCSVGSPTHGDGFVDWWTSERFFPNIGSKTQLCRSLGDFRLPGHAPEHWNAEFCTILLPSSAPHPERSPLLCSRTDTNLLKDRGWWRIQPVQLSGRCSRHLFLADVLSPWSRQRPLST